IGQPLFAVSTAFSNAALSAFGIFTVVSRCDEVTAKPSPTLSRLTVAFVSMLCAVMPACPRKSDSAIEKHAACAAATSSSGLVPVSFSNRIEKLYGTLDSAPLLDDTVPRPSLRPPFHTALALLFIGPRRYHDNVFS